MTIEEVIQAYPWWRTEMFSRDSRPLVNGQSGMMFVGLALTPSSVHALKEIRLCGLNVGQVADAECFYSAEWHSWGKMPNWIRDAIAEVVAANLATGVVGAAASR